MGHCIILHGHQLQGEHMLDFEHEIRRQLGEDLAAQWRFWRPSFDYRRDFVTAAQHLRDYFNSQERDGVDFERTVFVCYSMGGIVARQLVAWGFPCDALLTVSTPHGGLPPWTIVMRLFGHESPRSMLRGSAALNELNHNPVDLAHRDRYHLFGVAYRFAGITVESDGLIPYRSQVTPSDGVTHSPHSRQRIELEISERERLLLPMVGIHGRLCHHPRAVAPMLQRAARVMASTTSG